MLFLLFGCTSSDDATYTKLSNFFLVDVNSTSETYLEAVSPAAFRGQASAWYFGHSTWPYCRGQVGHLETLQNEIRQELEEDGSPLQIEIIGINAIGREADNDVITASNKLKWLQDDELHRVWDSWDPDYRDVYILNTKTLWMDEINLTNNDMALEKNRDKLKAKLLAAAEDNDTGL